MFRRTLTVGAGVTTALLLLLAVAAPNAWAATSTMPFTAGPSTPGTSYFSLTLAPGASQKLQLRVANVSSSSAMALVSAVRGETGPTSGDVYLTPTAPCMGDACWITQMPPRVTMPAKSRKLLPLTVTVPTGTAPGQYLAGVTVKDPSATTNVHSGPGRRGSISATVIREITVGVAVTVTGGPLQRVLAITSVRGSLAGKTPAVAVTEVNLGNTWLHPKGHLAVGSGANERVLPLASGTILPGASATLRALLPPGLPKTTTVHATLCYGHNGTPPCVSWSGTVTTPQAPIAYTPSGTPAEQHQFLPTASTMGVIGYVGIAAAALAVAGAMWWLLLFARRHRRRRVIL